MRLRHFVLKNILLCTLIITPVQLLANVTDNPSNSTCLNGRDSLTGGSCTTNATSATDSTFNSTSSNASNPNPKSTQSAVQGTTQSGIMQTSDPLKNNSVK